MTNKNVNLLQNIPAESGIDSVLVGDVVTKLYEGYSYRVFMSNYWIFTQVASQSQDAAGGESTLELVPAALRTAIARDCIESAVALTQAVNAFDWDAYLSRLKASAIKNDTGQTQRRSA